MSNTLRTYEDPKASEYEGFGYKSETMMVTAFMGANKYGSGIQVTMDNEFFQLNDKQVRDLIEVLHKRVDGVEGYQATGHLEEEFNNDV